MHNGLDTEVYDLRSADYTTTTVLLQLEYAPTVWSPYTKHKLDMVQRNSHYMSSKTTAYIAALLRTAMMKELEWMTLEPGLS